MKEHTEKIGRRRRRRTGCWPPYIKREEEAEEEGGKVLVLLLELLAHVLELLHRHSADVDLQRL